MSNGSGGSWATFWLCAESKSAQQSRGEAARRVLHCFATGRDTGNLAVIDGELAEARLDAQRAATD